MEGAYILLVVGSGAAGFLVRGRISVAAARTVLAAGVVAIALGILTLQLVLAGKLPFWTGGMTAVVLLALGGLLFPFGLAAGWSRGTPGSTA